jgi:EAL domain-containing protein (putative c-di-GMP-specific phosphodiesterase class I)
MPPVAVESLARGTRVGAFGSPSVMFAAAREKGLVEALDCRCIRAAFEAAADLSTDLDLFLNVHPRTLCLCSDFPAFLADEAARAGIALSRVTLEVLEHARVADRQCCQLHASLEVLRDLGVRVAVDDVGAEPEEARRLLLFRPHYLKLDAGLVRRARAYSRDRALLHAICEFGRDMGAEVIVEGVERPCDLALVAAADAAMAQGYMLCPPLPADELVQRGKSITLGRMAEA